MAQRRPLPAPVSNNAGVVVIEPTVLQIPFGSGVVVMIDMLRSPRTQSIITQMTGHYTIPVPTTKMYGEGVYTLILYYASTTASALAGLPDAYALTVTSVVEFRGYPVVHEVYNLSRRTTGAKGSGLQLAKFLATRYLEIGENSKGVNPVVWLGVRTNEPQLIDKVYRPAGFYFPNTDAPGSITPRGIRPGFEFYAGYACPLVQEFLATPFARAVQMTVPSTLVTELIGNTGEQYGLLSTSPHEIGGSLVGTGVLKEGTPRTKSPPENSCFIPFPEINHLLGRQQYIVHFHTHPFICHQKAGLVGGFPSTQDYLAYLTLSAKVDAHMVFAREGVFSYQLHPFHRFLIARGYVGHPTPTGMQAFATQAQEIQLDRIGSTPYMKSLADRIRNGLALTPNEVEAIKVQDPNAIRTMIQKMSLLGGVIGAIGFPFMLIQFTPRGQPATFALPAQISALIGARRHKTRRQKVSASSPPSGPKRSGLSADGRRLRSGRRTRAYSKRRVGY